jgi:hypothetical protein
MSETTRQRTLSFEDDNQTRLEIAEQPEGGPTPYRFTIVPNGRLRELGTLAIDAYGLALLRQWIDEALAHVDVE